MGGFFSWKYAALPGARNHQTLVHSSWAFLIHMSMSTTGTPSLVNTTSTPAGLSLTEAYGQDLAAAPGVPPDLGAATYAGGVIVRSIAGKAVEAVGFATEPRPPVSSET